MRHAYVRERQLIRKKRKEEETRVIVPEVEINKLRVKSQIDGIKPSQNTRQLVTSKVIIEKTVYVVYEVTKA